MKINEFARVYVERYGFSLVLIEPGRKFPTANDWGNQVITDADAAEAFYTEHGDWNMGLALGPSGMCSLDIDCAESWHTVLDEFGIPHDALDGYPTIQGDPKGSRVMFRVPNDTALKYAKLNWSSKLDPDGSIHRSMMKRAMASREADDYDEEKRLREEAKQYAFYTVFELRASDASQQRQDVLPPSVHPETKRPYKWLTKPPAAGEQWPEPPGWLLAIWEAWDDFKPQMKDACPWAVRVETPPPKPKQVRDSQGASVIDECLNREDLRATLTRLGYKAVGRRRFLSPHSGTGMPGVVMFDGEQSCWVHHASDPLNSEESGKPVNAFDLICEYEYGGDASKAVKALADEYGLKRERTKSPQAAALEAPPPGMPPDDLPPAGGPDDAVDHPGQQADTEPAQDEPPEPAPDPTSEPPEPRSSMPFRPLGFDGAIYYYLPRGTEQVCEIRRGSHTSPSEMLALAPIEWWDMAYAKEKGGCDWQAAASSCMRACEARGVYSLRNVRGRGAWYDGGSSVLHLGDRLIVDGKPWRIADHDTRYIYTRQSPMESTIDAPMATNDEAKEVFDIVQQMNWSTPFHGWAAAGWIALAPICGALGWRPHLWVTAQRGAGKAQPLSSCVLTPSGWEKMGNISVGDIVTTPDNTHAHVLGVYPQGEKQIYKITFSDGRTARATADHLWKVRDCGTWRLRTTEQLIARLSVDSEWGRSVAIQLAEPVDVKRNRKTKLPLHPYVLGALLGDGHMAGKPGQRAGQIRLTSFDEEITERVRGFLPDWMGVFETNRPFEFRFGDLSRYGSKTRNLVKDLRLIGSRSDTKFIPKQYLEASIDDRIHLMQGLMDTDGTVGKNGCLSYCTVSEQLRDDVCYLVRSLGGSALVGEKLPTYTHNGEKRTGKKAYTINIRLKDRKSAFSLPRKLARLDKEYQYQESFYLGVKSIEEDGFEEAQCIAIDHPDRLYVTDDFVVTHNTWFQEHIISPMLGQSALIVQGGTTEAGIRQHLHHDARPVIFDEAESEDHGAQKRMKSVIELARGASSDGGAEIAKGTASGGGMTFKMRSMFLLGSVNVSLSQAADESRFTVVSLSRPDKTAEEVERFNKFSVHVGNTLTPERCAAIRARSYYLIPVIRKNAKTLAQAVAESLGSQRIGDQVGTLLAGAVSLSMDREISIDEARAWTSKINLDEAREAEEVSDEGMCLNAIMQTQIMFDAGAHRYQRTISEVVLAAAGRKALSADAYAEDCNTVLARHGLSVDGSYLLVSNTHNELKKMLRDTPWAAGWRRILSRFDGAETCAQPVRFAGSQTRAVRIPLDAFL